MGKVTLWSLGKDFKKPSGSSAHFLCHNSKEYLVLTFLGGVLLTLLLMALVFLIIKSYRKCKSPRAATALLFLSPRIELALRGSKICIAHPLYGPRTQIPLLLSWPLQPSTPPTSNTSPPPHPFTQDWRKQLPIPPGPIGETCPSSSWHLWQVTPVPGPWIPSQFLQPR